MSKTKAKPTGIENNHQRNDHERDANEPLSGSKKVKNRQHSRAKHGEGS
jgi:small acid-soluble spore protein P (minor)